MNLFQNKICNIDTWSSIFQSIDSFEPLIRFIFHKHNLVFSKIENCIPGSNAVFKVGNYIVKIFAPKEAQVGNTTDYETEKFSMERANNLLLNVPRLYAYGEIRDSYLFRYLIMEYIDATPLNLCSNNLTQKEKETIGQSLRHFTDKMNTTCKKFNSHKLFSTSAEKRWENFSSTFQTERKHFIHNTNMTSLVYVHGDLTRDNILLLNTKEIRVIDYADALLAPIELEYSCLICEAFQFEIPYLIGFFGNYNKEEITDICLYGLLMHDFGFNIILDCFGDVNSINSILKLREMILRQL